MKELTTNAISTKLVQYVDTLAKTNTAVRVGKPIIKRAIPNLLKRADGYLSLLADENGKIDYEGIIDDYVNDLLDGEKIDIPGLRGSSIGEGKFTIQLPARMGKLIFKAEDFADLKSFLTT